VCKIKLTTLSFSVHVKPLVSYRIMIGWEGWLFCTSHPWLAGKIVSEMTSVMSGMLKLDDNVRAELVQCWVVCWLW